MTWRKSHQDKKLSNSDIGESWRTLPKEEKEPFETQAEDEKTRYEQDLNEWQAILAGYAKQAEDDAVEDYDDDDL